MSDDSKEEMFTWTGPKEVFDALVRDAMRYRGAGPRMIEAELTAFLTVANNAPDVYGIPMMYAVYPRDIEKAPR